MDYLIPVAIAILVSNGGLWYVVGQLVNEVRHNRELLNKVLKKNGVKAPEGLGRVSPPPSF